MKQSSSSSSDDMNDLHNQMEVASILLQLPQLIASRTRLLLPPLSLPSWGTKRKRSAEDTPFLRRLRFSSPPPLPPQSSNQEIIPLVLPLIQPPEKPKVETASSPATPLSFSPSESDEKPKRLKRKLSVKKRKEELLQIKNECTITNELLRKEIEQTKHYLKHLQSQNMSLRARKQELSEGSKKDRDKDDEEDDDDDAKMADEERGNNKWENVMIPDLNVSPLPVWMEVYQPLDHENKSFSKAMAAQARQRRMLICRDKNSGPITKLRTSRK